MMIRQSQRRFWKNVTLKRQENSLYALLLDSRPISLPGGMTLEVASPPLAEAMMAEWAAISPDAAFTPEALTLTRMVGTMIERIAPDLRASRAVLLAYGLDDALCYFVAGQDDGLRDKVLAWAAGHGLYPQTTTGLMPLDHAPAYREGLQGLLLKQDEVVLTCLGVLAPLFGSLLIPLALLQNVITAEEALSLGYADERQQLQTWGCDNQLAGVLDQGRRDMHEALRFYHLARSV